MDSTKRRELLKKISASSKQLEVQFLHDSLEFKQLKKAAYDLVQLDAQWNIESTELEYLISDQKADLDFLKNELKDKRASLEHSLAVTRVKMAAFAKDIDEYSKSSEWTSKKQLAPNAWFRLKEVESSIRALRRISSGQ